MSEFLRAIGLQPIEWNQAVTSTDSATPFIRQILEGGFSSAQAVLVLLTGDDEARLRPEHRVRDDPPYESALTPQVRQNVLFEAGIAFATHQKRTVVCQVGELWSFSDIFGRHLVHLNNSVTRRQELAQRLQIAGCDVDLSGTDWHSAGDFEVPDPTSRGRKSAQRRWTVVASALLALATLIVGVSLSVRMFRTSDASHWTQSGEYVQEFNAQRNLGFYLSKVKGRLRDGIEEFRAEWKRPRPGVDWASYHWMSRQDYEQKERDFAAQGYSLESLTTFTDGAGNLRYLATRTRQK